MAARELTPKEQQFAKAVALGSSQCEAYSRVYSADASRATKRANGHNISKRPRVAKEIKRLRCLLPVDDYAGIKTKMIERLLEIAENDSNSVAQHRAIVTLIKYADGGAGQKSTKEPVNVAELVRELLADLEPEASVEWPEEPAAIADDDLMTPSVQVNEPRVEKERELLLDKPQLTRPVNPAYAAAEAKAEAFRAMREAETRAHEESIRRSREEVRRITAIYREQGEAALSRASSAEEPVTEAARDSSIDPSECGALPLAYRQASGPRPGYRRETVPGRFPPQYRWVPCFEGDES
jgi:hypothetical protein